MADDEVDLGPDHDRGYDCVYDFVVQERDEKTVNHTEGQWPLLWRWRTSFDTRKMSLRAAVVAAGADAVDVVGTSTAHRMTYEPACQPGWALTLLSAGEW